MKRFFFVLLDRPKEYPLNYYRNQQVEDRQRESSEFEEKLQNMDTKLETIQKHIIDDAVKYVGAHEGETFDRIDLRSQWKVLIFFLCRVYFCKMYYDYH